MLERRDKKISMGKEKASDEIYQKNESEGTINVTNTTKKLLAKKQMY